MMRRPRTARSVRLVFLLLCVCGSLALFEGGSFLFITYGLPRFKPYYYADYYDRVVADVTEASLAAYAAKRYDPDLGWDYRPGQAAESRTVLGDKIVMNFDAEGSRRLPFDFGPVEIATYGDSYTAGTEVGDDQTWQYFLSRLTGTRVLNFGVYAYGTDQALLKIEKTFARRHVANLVVLAMIPDDINRIVGAYRPFYARPEAGDISFKPLFHQEDGAFRLVNVAPRPLRTRAEFGSALEQAKRYDYWYQTLSKAAISRSFPYSLELWKPFERQFLKPGHAGLWSETAAVQVLRYILERFAAHGAANSYVPVFVLMPEYGRELAAGQFAADPATVAAIKRDFAHKLVVIDLPAAASGRPFDPDRYNIEPNHGHPSAYGNELLAKLLEVQLRPLIRRSLAVGPGRNGG